MLASHSREAFDYCVNWWGGAKFFVLTMIVCHRLLIIFQLLLLPVLSALSLRGAAVDGDSLSADSATMVSLIEEAAEDTEYADHPRRRAQYRISNDEGDLTSVNLSNDESGSDPFDPRIIGGTLASSLNEDFSYAVSLQDRNGNHYCGASLVSKDCILTAAHCTDAVTGKGPITAVVGRIVLSKYGVGEEKQIKFEKIHPKYDLTKANVEWSYDFALMCFEDPIRSSAKVIKLNKVASTPRTTSLVNVMGWGDTNPDQSISLKSDELRVAKLRVVSNAQCSTSYQSYSFGQGNVIKDEMMCAMHRTQDTCQGDSGGPMVFQGKLVGVTSWGVGCNDRDFPGVYSRISSAYGWIRKSICFFSMYPDPSFFCDEYFRK